MKKAFTFLIQYFCFTILTACGAAHAQGGPDDGTYFIINTATGRALTPVDGGVHSNMRLKKFNKSGMQKWTIKKYITKGRDGKKMITYTIKNAASGFFLRPHHVPDNGNAIVAGKDAYSDFLIDADQDRFVLKNIKMGGDAMYSKNTGFSDDEPWFGPDEAGDAYRWRLIPVE